LKILFDTNVILDVLLDREPFSTTAAQLFSKVDTGDLVGYLCATTITTVHYLTTKVIGAQQAQHEIAKLLTLFEIAPVNRVVLKAALELKFTDFEDAVIHESATHVGAQAIITRNPRDFKKATVSVYSPDELLKILMTQA
jgi:predicted nucleic acid-binding protein